MYAISYESDPGRVLSISEGAYALPSQALVESVPEGGVIGDLWYVDGSVVKTADLTEAQREALGLTEQTTPAAGVSLKAVRPVDNGVSFGGDEPESGDEEEGGEDEPDEETDVDIDDVGIGPSGTLCTITLAPGEWALAGTGADAHYELAFQREILTPSTVLYIRAVNRGAMAGDIEWLSGEGVLTFSSEEEQISTIVIDGVLVDTGDPWQAYGKIEAHPGAGWAAVTYRQSLHTENWSAAVAAGAELTIQTPVNMSAARLLMWGPGMITSTIPGVMMTRVYVNGGGYLCFTLFNAGADTATVTDADIRILYAGRLSGFVPDSQDDETVAEYIGYRDFSGI